jgi:putative NIF3 family GTP cyclohydrolase 1 type 2
MSPMVASLAFPPTLSDLAAALDDLLVAERFRGTGDPAGIWRSTARPVAALGLALAPWAGLPDWVADERLGAVFLHRPWGLAPDALGETGVLAYHLAFDERLTLGANPALAAVLSLTGRETLGRKDGRPIGMIGAVPETPIAGFVARLAREFGGLDAVRPGRSPAIGRVAVVGAMTDGLVREAVRRGADLYLTGQLRVPARPAVAETGLAVVAVGHARGERWGLRALAAILRHRFPALRVVVAP